MRRARETLRAALERVVRWCDEASRLVDALELQGFVGDTRTQYAVSKCVEQVGEAAGRVVRDHPDFVSARPDLPLVVAYNMRNRLAHAYDDVNLTMLWTTAREEAPALARELRSILADLDADRS